MRILILGWRDPKHPLSGGAEQVMHEHAKGWTRNGHEVTLFTSIFKGGLAKETIDGVQIVREGDQILGVHLAAFIWYVFKKHPKYDLVVDQFHGIPFFTPLYVKAKKLAVLQEVAGKVWFKNDLPTPLNWIVGFLGFAIEPFVFLLYRKVPFIVGSDSAKESLVKMGISRSDVKVIPHGVILDLPTKIPTKEKIYTVAFLGALAKDKGIEDAIYVFSLLKKKYRKMDFWVIGKGGIDFLRRLKNLSRRLGLADEIKFWGFVSQKKKFELLARSHILINPSFLEGWGLVNIEANAVGTPVVAYKSPGLIDSVKEGVSGVFCKRNTPESMAESIVNLLTDGKLYTKLCRSSIFWSKNFKWEKSRKMSTNLIESL